MDFEIYESIEGRKRRFVVGNNGTNIKYDACKFFHVSPERLVVKHGFVLNNQLYWEYPGNKKAKSVWVVYTRRKS